MAKITTRAGLRSAFNITDSNIAQWLTRGAPKSIKSKYNLLDWAHWVDLTPGLANKFKIEARKILAANQVSQLMANPATTKKISLGKKGIEEAVERARTEEVEAHRRYMEARAANDPMAATMLEEWQGSCEFLSKAEPTLLKFLKDRGDVSPNEDFQKWMAKKIQAFKSAFLSLPSKLAPTLEGKEWPAIQKTLETELEAIFDKLSK